MAAVDDAEVHDAVTEVLRYAHMNGSPVEFAVISWPKGQPVLAVNVTAVGVTPDRLREALEYGAAQIVAATR